MSYPYSRHIWLFLSKAWPYLKRSNRVSSPASMTSPFPLPFTAVAIKSFARPRVNIFILWAFVIFGGIQGWLWWGLDASASMPVGSLFLSSSLPSPPLPKPNQSNTCKSIHQNLFEAQQIQLKFCESTPLREDASSPSSPRYLQALRLTCPLSALSFGNRERTMTHWVAKKDRNVTLFGYAEKDKVKQRGKRGPWASACSKRGNNFAGNASKVHLFISPSFPGESRHRHAWLLGDGKHVRPPSPPRASTLAAAGVAASGVSFPPASSG